MSVAPRAVLYLRQSVDATGDGEAIGRQRIDCLALAHARGWRVVQEFVDNDVSATARHRPGFEALMAGVARRAFDVIVIWHVDRLVRRLADLEPVLSGCQRSDIQIATVTGELDPSTDAGRLVARILSSVAQAEVERKGIRQRRANRQRAEQGIVRLVRRPFGYDLHGRQVRREAAALRWAADQVISGRSAASVARDLNSRQVFTSTGAAWRASSLIKVLKNPRYAGVATYHGVPVASGRWTPILDPDTRSRLASELGDPARRYPTHPAHKHLLSGIARCGICGEKVGTNRDGRTGSRIYRCPRLHLSRAMEPVDREVTRAVLEHISRNGISGITAIGPAPGTDTRELQDLLAQMRQTRARINAATTAFATGDLPVAQLAEISARLRTHLAALDESYAQALHQPALASLAAALRRARTDRSLPAAWSHLTLDQRRDFIRATVTVTIAPAGRGHGFTPSQLQLDWTAGS
jgi:DNA invertase Pin-like site-specific DNA recombinase